MSDPLLMGRLRTPNRDLVRTKASIEPRTRGGHYRITKGRCDSMTLLNLSCIDNGQGELVLTTHRIVHGGQTKFTMSEPQAAPHAVTRDWAQWQGETVDGVFRLDRYLGGNEHSGVFATEFNGKKAAIKLRAGEPRSEPGAELSHPNLLRILRTGRWEREGAPLSYVVMEYADEVLSNFIPERSLEAEEARETLAPVLDALAYLHGRGLVHGRIKPSNIMSIGGKLKISSDGLRRSTETNLMGVRGPYDAPEASEGHVTPALDMWSVGVTVVEMQTQETPAWDRAGNPVLPATLEEPFREIASHCLRPDPQRRWSVAQIADRLAGRTPVEEIPATPTASAAVASVHAPAKPKTTAVVVGAAAVVLVVAGAVFLRSGPTPETPAVAPTVAPRQEPVTLAPAAPPEEQKLAAPAKRLQGKVEHAEEPDVSANALGTIQGRVKVRMAVQVDSSGKVVETKLDTPRVSRYFATAALEAARRWKFVPPMEDGTAAGSSWVLEFDFGRGGTQTHSRQVS
jgi:TonB family protein